jgi:Uma2 family endonuclease
MPAVASRRTLPNRRRIPDDVPPPFAVRRFSVEEYHRLMDVGILRSGDPYELLDGWITLQMTKNPPHEVCLRLLHAVLGSQMPSGWMYDSQLAITLSTSEPEPDGMIVKGSPRDYVSNHPRPRDLALVIEVAEASLTVDRKKAELYARDGVPRYWLINLVDEVVEEHSDPVGKGPTARYKTIRKVDIDGELFLRLGKKTVRCLVADILP